MADNKEFAEQIASAMVELGTEEALSCMSRVMCWVAAEHALAIKLGKPVILTSIPHEEAA